LDTAQVVFVGTGDFAQVVGLEKRFIWVDSVVLLALERA